MHKVSRIVSVRYFIEGRLIMDLRVLRRKLQGLKIDLAKIAQKIPIEGNTWNFVILFQTACSSMKEIKAYLTRANFGGKRISLKAVIRDGRPKSMRNLGINHLEKSRNFVRRRT